LKLLKGLTDPGATVALFTTVVQLKAVVSAASEGAAVTEPTIAKGRDMARQPVRRARPDGRR